MAVCTSTGHFSGLGLTAAEGAGIFTAVKVGKVSFARIGIRLVQK